MKLHTLTLVTLTALATLAALPGTAATDPSTDTASTQQDGRGRNRGTLHGHSSPPPDTHVTRRPGAVRRAIGN